MTERKYLPTFAELCDRLSIVILKSVFIPEHHDAYMDERRLIEHDIDLLLGPRHDRAVTGWTPVDGKNISALMIIMLANRVIWENESQVRRGSSDSNGKLGMLLRRTHSINGIRATAKNELSRIMGERVDLKVDCLAADLQEFFGENWNLFEGSGREKR